MDLQQEKISELKRILATWVKLALLAFVVLALVALPFRFDSKNGVFVTSAVIAKDGGGDSGGDGESDGDSGGDGDDGSYGDVQ